MVRQRKAKYSDDELIKVKIDLLKKPPKRLEKDYLRPLNDPLFRMPTVEEIREEFEPWSNETIKDWFGMKDSSAIRKYLKDPSHKDYTQMRPRTWRLFLILSGRVPAI